VRSGRKALISEFSTEGVIEKGGQHSIEFGSRFIPMTPYCAGLSDELIKPELLPV